MLRNFLQIMLPIISEFKAINYFLFRRGFLMIWVGIEVKLIPLNSINFRSEICEKLVQK